MSNIQLLDCTLRDGGYINDWNFGRNNIRNIFRQLVKADVDIIEIGFLDERRIIDLDRSIMPDVCCVEEKFNDIDKGRTDVVGMIDYGTYRSCKLRSCNESFLDGIRVIFKKNVMKEAINFCREVKELGYKVFVQVVSITSYNREELLELIKIVNDLKPYAISIVDTYGVLYPEDLLFYYNILDEYVDLDIKIGFHGHNNLQLAYSNSLTFLNKESRHDKLVDGTLYGMGKGAGNTPLELLARRLNEKYNKRYDMQCILGLIENIILKIYNKYPWGYSTSNYLSGVNKCHPKYVEFFRKKKYSIDKIDSLLVNLGPEEKKLIYDRLVAEKIYNSDLANNKINFRLFEDMYSYNK